MSTENKLMKARCRLLSVEPWYGSFLMLMFFKERPSVGTMGVRFINGGQVECSYNKEFTDNLDIKQLYGVLKHEVEHIVRLHPARRGDKQHYVFNVAADMCINGKRQRPKCCYDADGDIVVPMETAVWVPKDWDDNLTAEEYYKKLFKESEKNGGGGVGAEGCGGVGAEGSLGDFGDVMDDHGVWSENEVGADEARQAVKDMCDQATARAAGTAPGHLSDAIKDLEKPIVKWQQIFRNFTGRWCGNRRKTYARRNRRYDQFGTPGVSHHAAATVSIIVDTSGSISKKDLGQFFGEIDAIAHKTKVGVLQWDTKFCAFNEYKRNDWKKIEIKGRGGTSHFDEALQWLIEHGVVGDACVFFTDGYLADDWPQNRGIPMIFVITTDQPGPTWAEDGKAVTCRLNPGE